MLYKTLDSPLSIHLEVNTSCNQKCIHCYNFWRKEDKPVFINLKKELAEHIVQQLKRFGVFHVVLNGGEPLMNLSTLLFLIDALSRNQISFSLNTNLTLLTESSAQKLKDAGLEILLTSLLSHNPAVHNYLAQEENSFENFLNGFKIAKKVGFKITVNMVVSKVNKRDILGVGLLANSLGASSFSATRVMPQHPYNSDFNELLALDNGDVDHIIKSLMILHSDNIFVESLIPYPTCSFNNNAEFLVLGRKSCSAGKTSCVIGADGLVRACPHDSKVYGDIKNENLGLIWQNMSEWRDGSLIPLECKKCHFFSQCGGGCRMTSTHVFEKDTAMRENQMESKHNIAIYPSMKSLDGIALLRVKETCRFRKDGELCVINTGGMKNVFINSETFGLLSTLYSEKSKFTVSELITKYDLHMNLEECCNFFSHLVNRGVIEILT